MRNDLHYQNPLFVGIDVGGTNIKLGIVDDNGTRLIQSEIRTEEQRGPADAVERMAVETERLVSELGLNLSDIHSLGLGTPGPMDIPAGIVTDPPTMPHWRHFGLRDALSERLNGKPVAFTNDANAAAFGEFCLGGGRDSDSLVLLTLGTGVGGGIIIGGQLLDGANSFGGECGMMVIDSSSDARECAWGGQQGQLEAYASASGLVARAQERLREGASSSVRDRIGAGEQLTAKILAEEAESGDEFARDLILEAARYLGVGVTNIVHVLDPGTVLLGGAMNFGRMETRIGRAFLQAVRAEFESRSFSGVTAKTRVAYAELGADAGFVGAAGLARQRFSK